MGFSGCGEDNAMKCFYCGKKMKVDRRRYVNTKWGKHIVVVFKCDDCYQTQRQVVIQPYLLEK